ncbi:tRNA glutamyl-Q(34) synthetase GluQRS [Altericroceibacterium spongiae]|uniref:tRNA glutamyl-Q(34) synthetase GluQRS n=1 Tax=Altericroceibacterium spongiae TaxID=2320269 RepID=A0A420EIQ5_9SPHN|nr:tRNA glutamyl-Q(34) synthetase GluQRS [Altericroceibacterium spongiae]RKF20601.1 tRNA glutamyl-Q(34) synthetase GluQRS [Altericroceibacterium spongiae]
MIVTRFAPSPNGSLHLGHAYSAITAHDCARMGDGRFLLRIEDIDGSRSRSELADEFRADLQWLGLSWEDVPPQSTRLARYSEAAERLKATGLLYPCNCTRADIMATDPEMGPLGPIYPGHCRHNPPDPTRQKVAWRMDVAAAMEAVGPLTWIDERFGEQRMSADLMGDVVLVRKDCDTPSSYHLSATLDDAADGVTLVTRGMDLFMATHIHRLLQALLGLPSPHWYHHDLLVDDDGRKLAKRRGSPSLVDRRLAGQDGLILAADLRAGTFPAGLVLSHSLE